MPPLQKDIETAHDAQITKSSVSQSVTVHKENEAFLCRLGRRCVCIISFLILILAAVVGISVAFTGSPDVRVCIDLQVMKCLHTASQTFTLKLSSFWST
jgi:hypothetical protein